MCVCVWCTYVCVRLCEASTRVLSRGGGDAAISIREYFCDRISVPEILTTVGLLHLRMNDNAKAFQYLGQSLTHDPKNAKVRAHGQRAAWVRWSPAAAAGLGARHRRFSPPGPSYKTTATWTWRL